MEGSLGFSIVVVVSKATLDDVHWSEYKKALIDDIISSPQATFIPAWRHSSWSMNLFLSPIRIWTLKLCTPQNVSECFLMTMRCSTSPGFLRTTPQSIPMTLTTETHPVPSRWAILRKLTSVYLICGMIHMKKERRNEGRRKRRRRRPLPSAREAVTLVWPWIQWWQWHKTQSPFSLKPCTNRYPVLQWYGPLARYAKLWVAHAPRMPGTFYPPPQVSDPDMTHVPWCMPGSLTSCFLWSRGGENVPGIPGACATHNFTYLVRGQWTDKSEFINPVLNYWYVSIIHLCP